MKQEDLKSLLEGLGRSAERLGLKIKSAALFGSRGDGYSEHNYVLAIYQDTPANHMVHLHLDKPKDIELRASKCTVHLRSSIAVLSAVARGSDMSPLAAAGIIFGRSYLNALADQINVAWPAEIAANEARRACDQHINPGDITQYMGWRERGLLLTMATRGLGRFPRPAEMIEWAKTQDEGVVGLGSVLQTARVDWAPHSYGSEQVRSAKHAAQKIASEFCVGNRDLRASSIQRNRLMEAFIGVDAPGTPVVSLKHALSTLLKSGYLDDGTLKIISTQPRLAPAVNPDFRL